MTLALGTPVPRHLRTDPLLWTTIGVLLFTAVCLASRGALPWVVVLPAEWTIPLAQYVNVFADWLVALVQPIFRASSALLTVPMRAVQNLLQWLPWPAVMLMVVGLALHVSGPRLAFFAFASLLYLVLVGYWQESMNTLALMLLAVPMAAITGFALGVWAQRSRRFRVIIMPTLDLMQTVPAFAYLIPLLLLFGFGPVVGLIASAIYAVPPMVRNTTLGLDLVPADIEEAGRMGGCTRWQQFWQVEVPTAMPQFLIGLNQTTMAALSMVIVAAIIGGFEDIGWEVLSSMRKAEFGQSLLSGVVIALLAILIDRITRGIAKARGASAGAPSFHSRYRFSYVIIASVIATVLLRLYVQEHGNLLPDSQADVQISVLNQILLGFVRDYSGVFDAIRNGALYGLILPLRIGISGAATPAIWGAELNGSLKAAYAVFVFALAGVLLVRIGWRAATAALVAGAFLYSGFLGFPWPAFIVLTGLLAFSAAGWRLALFAISGLTLILVSGFWVPLMQSLYLTLLAVVLCFLIGGALGVWAAHNDRVSAVLAPINDTLQTMPQFVFLIPALMFFKVGEFTALIAIMLYAIVPPIRYVEHGIRSVRPDAIEAVRQMGSTPAQLLWQAKIPLALPVLMLGVNQTIMAALSMLAIAALVGTRDLGQQVYVALGKADAGMGLIAGLSIAFIAITSDRIVQAWLRRQPGAASFAA
jgi:glycine betaine/proline transport system permease protein